MTDDQLTPTEENALKWVLLCEQLEIDPRTTSVLDFKPLIDLAKVEREHGRTPSYVIVNTSPTTDESPEYWIAGRDSKGCIRLNQGKGMHIADPEQGYPEVLAWFQMATEPRWKATYAAALSLLAREQPGDQKAEIAQAFADRSARERNA